MMWLSDSKREHDLPVLSFCGCAAFPRQLCFIYTFRTPAKLTSTNPNPNPKTVFVEINFVGVRNVQFASETAVVWIVSQLVS